MNNQYVIFNCVNCGKRLRATTSIVGKRMICKNCQTRVTVPPPGAPTGPHNIDDTSDDSDTGAVPGFSPGYAGQAVVQDGAVENPVRGHGLLRIALGAALLLLALMAWATRRDEHISLTILSLLAAIHGLVEVLYGLACYLTFVPPLDYPENLRVQEQRYRDGLQVLWRKRLLQSFYDRADSVFEKLVYRVYPPLRWFSPSQRSLVRLAYASGLGIALCGLGFIASATMAVHSGIGYTLGADLVGAVAIGVVCILAIGACVPASPKQRESVSEYSSATHGPLERIGNPIDLFNHLIDHVFYSFRDLGRQCRVYWPTLAEAREALSRDHFSVVIVAETQPVLLDEDQGATRAAASILDKGCVFILVGFWATVLLFLPLGLPLILTSALVVLFVEYALLVAYRLHNTFRFRSDLFQLELNGTQTQRQLNSLDRTRSSTVQRESLVTSFANYKLFGARIISESSLGTVGSRLDRVNNSERDATHALNGPRSVIRIEPSRELDSRAMYVVTKLLNWRDRRSELDEVSRQDSRAEEWESAVRNHVLSRDLQDYRHQLDLERIMLKKAISAQDPVEIERMLEHVEQLKARMGLGNQAP